VLLSVAYTLLVGIPLSLMLMTAGCLLALTVVGLPLALVCFGLGFHVLTVRR